MQEELDGFLDGCTEQVVSIETVMLGRLAVQHLPGLGITAAQGGLGKAQFAVQTQHLIDSSPGWDLVICAGAAGALDDRLVVGDVVIGTETAEFDIRNNFGKPLLPRFKGDAGVVETFRFLTLAGAPFTIHLGTIASGDEDIVDAGRRRAVRDLTGALATGWEGAGGARASHFSNVPFVEIRGISDEAGESAAHDFVRNLPMTMRNIATVVVAWAKQRA